MDQATIWITADIDPIPGGGRGRSASGVSSIPPPAPIDMPLPFQPQQQQRTPNGWHLRWQLTGVPGWWRDQEPPRRQVRECLAAVIPGFDRRAPIDGLRDHGSWSVNPACGVPEYDLKSILAYYNVTRRADAVPAPQLLREMEARGYLPGGRYTREKCWRDDHISGGNGKGTCVLVSASGARISCFGHHSRLGGGPASVTAATLCGIATDDQLTIWMSGWVRDLPDTLVGPWLPRFIEELNIHSDPRGWLAATRLHRYLNAQPPMEHPDPPDEQFVWDSDLEKLATYDPQRFSLFLYNREDQHIMSRVSRNLPGFSYWDEETGDHAPNVELIKTALAGDPHCIRRGGLLPVRQVAVPDIFNRPIQLKNGRPLYLLAPENRRGATDISEFLKAVPTPCGMEENAEAALRLSWLLPAFTTTWPGGQPLMFYHGASGTGKTLTAQMVQMFWRDHVSMAFRGEVSSSELNNNLLFGRRGAIFLFDEAGGASSGSAIPLRLLAMIKTLMTLSRTYIRLFHTQRFSEAPVMYCWMATGRTLSAVSGLENDWRRRLLPIEFPEVPDPTYPRRVIDFVGTMDCRSVAAGLAQRFIELQLRDGEEMPAWSALLQLGETVGLTVKHKQLMDTVAIDDSAIEAFCEWWKQADRTEYPTDKIVRARLGAAHNWILAHFRLKIESQFDLANVLSQQAPAGFPVEGGIIKVQKHQRSFRFVFTPKGLIAAEKTDDPERPAAKTVRREW